MTKEINTSLDPITAIIVDDEYNARLVLKKLIEKENIQINIVAECSNLIEAVGQIKKHSPQVVFLDIQMPQYAGYEIVRFFEEIDFEIIFVTAFDDYAIKAFELNAMDYIVKPIERSRFSKTLARLHDTIKSKKKTLEYQHLLDTIQNQKVSKLIIPEIGNRRIVDVEQIIAMEADGSYTQFHMYESDGFVVSKTLKYFDERLKEDQRFFRAHRGVIVNLEHLKFFNKKEYSLILTNGLKMKISRQRIESFESTLS